MQLFAQITQNIKAWALRHRKPLMLVLFAFLILLGLASDRRLLIPLTLLFLPLLITTLQRKE